ncbi:ABC transporter permease [Prauserella endophytica]|uniref:ABC transporter permease n=1 Tax=Prauserella endophytica TaxID=1592324 RepID=A0ABY2S714_9PSEU|nr:ABC transporter permease [Prauserella endophytica]TKG71695.1 ABC transporter permease [Prauserella endophytica]
MGSAVLSGAQRRRPRRIQGELALLAPAALLLAVGLAIPLGLSVWLSVVDTTGGVNGYVWLFSNPVYLEITLRTFSTAALTALVCLALGYPYAYAMLTAGPKMRVFLLGCVVLPLMISVLVIAFAWLVILQPGGLASKLFPLGLGDGLLGTLPAVVLGLTHILIPYMILPLYTTMRSVDPKLVPAAMGLGATRTRAFWTVFVPLTIPGIASGVVFVFVFSLGFYVLPQLLGSPRQALIGQTIHTQVNDLLAWGRAGALAVVLILGTAAVFALLTGVVRIVGANRRGGRS